MFPAYTGQAVQVREQKKTVVDLRAEHVEGLAELLIQPKSVYLCFLHRANALQTQITPISLAEALSQLTDNTIFWDRPDQLAYNSRVLMRLLGTANCYQLTLGTDIASIIATIDELA